MASRVNYGQERAQKARAREAKREEKLRRREEASAKRKALREESQAIEPGKQVAKDDGGH